MLGLWVFVPRGQEDLTKEEKFKEKLEGSQGMSLEGREQGPQRSWVGRCPDAAGEACRLAWRGGGAVVEGGGQKTEVGGPAALGGTLGFSKCLINAARRETRTGTCGAGLETTRDLPDGKRQ